MVPVKIEPAVKNHPNIDLKPTLVPSTVSTEDNLKAGLHLKKPAEVKSVGNLDNCGSFWGDYSNNDHIDLENNGN